MKLSMTMCAGIAALCAMLAAPTAATMVTVTGTLNSVDSGLASQFQVGQSYVWTYSFDPNSKDFNSSPTRGDYRGAITNGRLEVGGYLATSTGGAIVVDDGTFGSGYDQYTVESDAWSGSILGGIVNGLFPFVVDMQLSDPTDTALVNDLLDAKPPTVEGYPDRAFKLSFAQAIFPGFALGVQRVYGNVESIAVVRDLPEPPTALLVLAGLVVALTGGRMWGGARKAGKAHQRPILIAT